MIEPPLSPDEPLRLQSLRSTNQLDSPLDERFERITRLAQRFLQVPIATISLIDAGRQWFKSAQGLDGTETSRQVSFCGHTILQDEVFVVPDARSDPRFSDNPLVSGAPNIVFYAGCPLQTADGSKIGSLCVIDKKPRQLSSDDIQILRDLAAIAESEFARSMHSAVQHELSAELGAVRRQAQVDSLTRIWNRESIFSILDSELARARRTEMGAGVIMADVDYFKRINDTLGHMAGDEVLRQAAKRILGAVREVDAVGRYGGEEFMVTLGACAGLEGATIVAERIRNRVGEAPFTTEFGEIPITISLGVAFANAATSVEGPLLVQTADAALYKAKHNGRNRVESSLFAAEPCLRKAS